MPEFILKYHKEELKSSDFAFIGKTIKERGKPIAIRYEFKDSVPDGEFYPFYEVNLANGRFCLNGLWVSPAMDNEKLLVDKKVNYRPIWFIHWLRRIAWGNATELSNEPIYILGWQMTENGKNIQKKLQIFVNGELGFG